MEKIAQVSPCGFMTLAQDVNSANPMVDYVSDVFLNKIEKTAQVTVPEVKPEVPKEEVGLGYHKPEPMLTNLGNVHFNFDKSDLTEEGKNALDQHIQSLINNPDVKIMIGGAPITQEFADKIGADEYAQDVWEAVTKAEQLVGGA